MRAPVERDGLVQNRRRSAEAPLPEAVAEDDNVGSARTAVGGGNRAAMLRLDAEQRERVGGHAVRLHPLGIGAAGEVGAPVLIARDEGQRSRVPADVERIGERQVEAPLLPLEIPAEDERDTLGVLVGERRQREDVHDAERGRVGADADGQRQHDGRRKRGRAAHQPESVREVLQKLLHEAVSVWRVLTRVRVVVLAAQAMPPPGGQRRDRHPPIPAARGMLRPGFLEIAGDDFANVRREQQAKQTPGRRGKRFIASAASA